MMTMMMMMMMVQRNVDDDDDDDDKQANRQPKIVLQLSIGIFIALNVQMWNAANYASVAPHKI